MAFDWEKSKSAKVGEVAVDFDKFANRAVRRNKTEKWVQDAVGTCR
jgi:hypothetical protein